MPAEPATPVASYVSAAIPPGSIDYYVVLMSESRPLVEAAIALGNVITNIARQPTEQQIRHLKLQWFLQEIEQTNSGEPRHPLMIELHRRTTHHRWLPSLRQLIEATTADIDRPPIAEITQLLPACHRSAEKQALLATVLGESSESSLTAARQLGTGNALTEFLRDGGWREKPIEPEEIAAIAHEHFAAAGTGTPAILPVVLQGRLYRRLLSRLEATGFDASRASLAPLVLLWHAWREARKLLRP